MPNLIAVRGIARRWVRHPWMRTGMVGVVLAASPAARGKDYSFVDRGNRREGIISSQEIVGRYLYLVGLHSAAAEQVATPDALAVRFSLPTAMKLRIRVADPATNYWMIPHRSSFQAGPQSFTWPATAVVEPLKIDRKRLVALVSSADDSLYLPAALQPAPAGTAPGYTFLFICRFPATIHGSVVQESAAGLKPVRTVAQRAVSPSPRPQVLLGWDGKDDEGNACPSGIYHLRIAGTLLLETAEEPVSVHVPFFHLGSH